MRRKTTAIGIGLWAALLLTGCASQQQKAFQSVEGKTHSAVVPVQLTIPEVSSWYGPRMKAVDERLKLGRVNMLFIGDSITNGWDSAGKRVWEMFYAPRNAVNMGFGWDRTQHVLWRIDHSDFNNVHPKLAIVMIGTNNSNGNDNTAEEIADGIIMICKRLRTRLPETKIILLAIFPRGEKADAQREKNARASLLASRIADNQTIFYMDINKKYLQEDGVTLITDNMPDYLHPSPYGYLVWAQAIEPKVAELMGETTK
jgi:lysophospholipase L1-like esterase